MFGDSVLPLFISVTALNTSPTLGTVLGTTTQKVNETQSSLQRSLELQGHSLLSVGNLCLEYGVCMISLTPELQNMNS